MKRLRQSKRRSSHIVGWNGICLLFALGVKVDAADVARYLVEADVIEAFEASPGDGPHAVVRDQEVFFPTHEDVLPLSKVLVGEVGFPG